MPYTGLPYLQSSLLLDAGFAAHGFSTRLGGCSPAPYDTWNFSPSTGDDVANVEENFEILASYLEVYREQIKGVHQIHSSRVVEALELSFGADGQAEQADGLVTQGPELVVGVKTADCVPVLLALPGEDDHPAIVSAVHAGWRGVAGRIVPEAVARIMSMALATAPPTATAHSEDESIARLLVAIGPHICADCFQVGPEVAEVFPDHHRPDPSEPGKSLVDLRGALAEQIAALGVSAAQIDQVAGCTMCDPEQRFFSHRTSGGQCGRMFNFIGAVC